MFICAGAQHELLIVINLRLKIDVILLSTHVVAYHIWSVIWFKINHQIMLFMNQIVLFDTFILLCKQL